MLLIIKPDIMPACSRREGGGFCTLLIAILIPKIPVSCLHRKYRNTGFVKNFRVVTAPGTLRIIFIQYRIGRSGNSMTTRNCQRPVKS